jgi:hypothetical protein
VRCISFASACRPSVRFHPDGANFSLAERSY